MSTRKRTSSNIVGYGLYLYFLGISFRNAAKALSFYIYLKMNHVPICWNWIQKYKLQELKKKKEISEFIIYETAIKVGSEIIWLWVAIEPVDKEILSIIISKERKICLL